MSDFKNAERMKSYYKYSGSDGNDSSHANNSQGKNILKIK